MKICHCIKMTEEENNALHIVLNVLEELNNDYMLSCDFEEEVGVSPGDICHELKITTAFLEKWR